MIFEPKPGCLTVKELIIIDSKQHLDFLNPSYEENFWIGGNVDNTGSWVWSSNKLPISLGKWK